MSGMTMQAFRAIGAGLAVLLVLSFGQPATAQFFDESLEQQEQFFEDDDRFFEERPEDFGVPLGPEQDFTEGDRFVEEGVAPEERPPVTERGRRFELEVAGEREQLPLNIAWGAGTGLLIGGWFALIREGDNRETQRSIGVGIVSGILLGALVGTRAVFDPGAPRAAKRSAPPPQKDKPPVQPLVSLTDKEGRVGVQLNF